MRVPGLRRLRRPLLRDRYDEGRTSSGSVDRLSAEDLRRLNELLPWRCFTVDTHGRPLGGTAWRGKRDRPGDLRPLSRVDTPTHADRTERRPQQHRLRVHEAGARGRLGDGAVRHVARRERPTVRVPEQELVVEHTRVDVAASCRTALAEPTLE